MVQNVKMELIESEIVNFYKALNSRHPSGGAWFEGGMEKQTESVSLKGNQDQAGSFCPPTRQGARNRWIHYSFLPRVLANYQKRSSRYFFFLQGENFKGHKTNLYDTYSQKIRCYQHPGFLAHQSNFGSVQLAKVLSNRFREVLQEVIDGNQFSFIKDRNIMDRVPISNESVEEYHSNKGVVDKLDLRKPMIIQFGILGLYNGKESIRF